VISSARRDDVISRFLADVDKEVCWVKKHNTEIEFTIVGSREKVMVIHAIVRERYLQGTSPWLKPHLVTYHKTLEKKEKMSKVVSTKK
jgi:hypothetical protein